MDCKRLRIGPGGAAVFLMILWALSLFAIWYRLGLFTWIGVDYGLFSAGAKVLASDIPEAVYDLKVVARQLEPFRAYYRGPETSLRIAPAPHLPLTFLLYIPFAQFAPHRGYLLWVALNLLLAVFVVRGLGAHFPGDRPWTITALALCYFPLVYTIFLGQPIVLMLFAFDRAYRAWERGRDFEAGLWSGVLFLKFQYLPVLILVLACKRRWPSLVGIAVTSLLIALASFAWFGGRVTAAYLESLSSVSGFREVHPLISPQHMINWRGQLVNVLPLWVSEAHAKGLTLLLSALTACSLVAVWRGPWHPAGPKFPMQMLATLLVTMVATFHNHIHGAALLLVPGMVLWARGGGPSPLPLLLRLGLFAPILFFTFGCQIESLASQFFVLMLMTLGAIVWAIRTGKYGDEDEDENMAAPITRPRAILRVAPADGLLADS